MGRKTSLLKAALTVILVLPSVTVCQKEQAFVQIRATDLEPSRLVYGADSYGSIYCVTEHGKYGSIMWIRASCALFG